MVRIQSCPPTTPDTPITPAATPPADPPATPAAAQPHASLFTSKLSLEAIDGRPGRARARRVRTVAAPRVRSGRRRGVQGGREPLQLQRADPLGRRPDQLPPAHLRGAGQRRVGDPDDALPRRRRHAGADRAPARCAGTGAAASATSDDRRGGSAARRRDHQR